MGKLAAKKRRKKVSGGDSSSSPPAAEVSSVPSNGADGSDGDDYALAAPSVATPIVDDAFAPPAGGLPPLPPQVKGEDDFGSSAADLAAALAFDLPDEFGAARSPRPGDGDSLFELPDVAALEKKRKSREKKKAKAPAEVRAREARKIKRSDLSALRSRLELDPSADYQPDTFVSSYDTASAILGESAKPFLSIDAAYIQAGHGILLLTALLCANVEYPGNPLTEFPPEIRNFLKAGLAVSLSINAVLAGLSAKLASEKGQSPVLWGVKALLLGGLAFDELNNAPDLTKKRGGRKRGN